MKIPEPAVVEYEPGGKTDNQEKNDQKMQNKNYFRHESISCLPSKFEGAWPLFQYGVLQAGALGNGFGDVCVHQVGISQVGAGEVGSMQIGFQQKSAF